LPRDNQADRKRLQSLLTEGLFSALHRDPVPAETAKFETYLRLFLQWNRVHRFTAYRRPEEIVTKLLLDSLLFLKVLPSTALRVLDFGTGAGIPGIPLKIVLPQIALTMLEARRRQSSFLAVLLRELGLKGVSIIRERAEQVLVERPELEEAFEAVVMRSAGPLGTVIPVALRFLEPGGICIVSGPPAGKTSRFVVEGALARWQSVPSPFTRVSRQFLAVQKIR